MKRYWLFAGDTFYPKGGMNDFIDSYDTEKECFERIAGQPYGFIHIFDTETESLVFNHNT